MGTWVEEFKALQSPSKGKGSTSLGSTTTKGNSRLQPSKAEQLEAELKLLEWHKLANNAAIKVGFKALCVPTCDSINLFVARHRYYKPKRLGTKAQTVNSRHETQRDCL
jgi:hypothetical protein